MSKEQTAGATADLTMDGRRPILPELDAEGFENLSTADVDKINARLAERDKEVVARAREEFNTSQEEAQEQADRDATLSTLQTFFEGNPGTDAGAIEFRSGLQDLMGEVHYRNPDGRPMKEIRADAIKLMKARNQVLLENQGDGSGELPLLRKANNEDTGMFSMMRFLSTMANQVKEKKENFNPMHMTGSEEMEYASDLLKEPKNAALHDSVLAATDTGRSRVVPFPMAALHPDMIFAETYGSDAANQRQPTYRRDALVEFFRPVNVLQDLGVPMLRIANDITLPRLSASLSAAWLAENAAITEGNITVTPLTTSPKRLGVLDTISWMLLAAGDQQFGIQPVTLMEMAASVLEAKEAAVYGTTITSGPTGIRGTTGVKTKAIGATDPTYADMLNMIRVIADDKIPTAMGKFLINPIMRELLSTIQRFATGSANILNDVVFREPGSGPANIGNYGASVVGSIAGKPTIETTHIPVASGGNTYIYFAIWGYVWCIDYSTAFLTIDDVSAAANGRTNITINSYHDVAVRFPAAFNVATHDTTP